MVIYNQDLDLAELQSFVEKATVEGQFHMDKFNEILGALSSAQGVYKFESDDADTLAILDAMNRASDVRIRETAGAAEYEARHGHFEPVEEQATC